MNIVKTLFGKPESKSQFQLKKESAKEWVVKKGSTVLYIGTKEMCETYMANAV